MVDREHVTRWVEGYERAWRASDADAVERLFTPDAAYRFSPVEPSIVGHEAIRGIWLQDEGNDFTLQTEPVAVEGDRAVVRARVVYTGPQQEYRDLWVLRFAPDGRVADFEEWAYWPGRGYTVAQERDG